jgi:hypothetical protein
MQFERTWRGEVIDCQYCKNGVFPHEHLNDRRKTNKRDVRYAAAPPRTIQQMIMFGDKDIDCE